MYIPQSNPDDAPGPDLCAGRKVTETHKALLWKLLNDDPTCPSRLVLHTIAETPEQIAVTLRHINRLRKAWGLNRGKGRPRQSGLSKKKVSRRGLVHVTPSLSFVGVHVFAVWWQQHGGIERRSLPLAAASDSHLSHAASRRRLSPFASPRADAASSLPSAVFCALVGD